MLGGHGGTPQAWTCDRPAYGDGRCDCGCGAADVDCTQQDLAHCEVCNGPGSCNLAGCPGRIDPADVTTCLAPPAGWTCTPSTLRRRTPVRVRMWAPGPRLQERRRHELRQLPRGGHRVRRDFCPSSISPTDNAHCAIPPQWTCGASSYGDGICNCGCGAVDVDCPDATAASCRFCDQSSCSPLQCGGVEPDDNAHCAAPLHLAVLPAARRDGKHFAIAAAARSTRIARLWAWMPATPATTRDRAPPRRARASSTPPSMPTVTCRDPTRVGAAGQAYGDGTCDCNAPSPTWTVAPPM